MPVELVLLLPRLVLVVRLVIITEIILIVVIDALRVLSFVPVHLMVLRLVVVNLKHRSRVLIVVACSVLGPD